MHELTVCRSLLAEAARVAAAHGATAIAGLALRIGPLSGIEIPQLVRAFEVARIGTAAERAELEIETAPVTVWCETCRLESPATVNALLCGGCGGWQVALRSGAELLLRRVDLVAPVPLPAASLSQGDRHVR